MNWGTRIVIVFIGFVGVLFTMVYISVNTDFYLVADNYYEQELTYEDQIQRIKNVNELTEKPELILNRKEQQLELTFPKSMVNDVEGKLSFFRSSNANLDKEYDLKFNEEGHQIFKVKEFLPGAWKVKMQWSANGKEYYKEMSIVL